jgi:hypothetical protein
MWQPMKCQVSREANAQLIKKLLKETKFVKRYKIKKGISSKSWKLDYEMISRSIK